MPLTPLPPENTARFWLKYTSGGVEHELMFRLGSGTTSATGQAAANTLATNLKTWLPAADSFLSLRWAANGSPLSFPLAFTPQVGTGTALAEETDKARFCSVVGRSAGGYRCRMTFFTPNIADTVAYRTATGVTTPGSTLYNIVTSASPPFVSVEGSGVIWNGYSNNGFNAYWQRRSR